MKRTNGKKEVEILEENETLYLRVCMNGYTSVLVEVDEEILEMSQDVIKEYFVENQTSG